MCIGRLTLSTGLRDRDTVIKCYGYLNLVYSFRSMDDLPLMLTPYDLMDFLGKGQRQTYELIHSEGFPYVQDGPKIKIPKWLLIEFINEKVRKGEPL